MIDDGSGDAIMWMVYAMGLNRRDVKMVNSMTFHIAGCHWIRCARWKWNGVSWKEMPAASFSSVALGNSFEVRNAVLRKSTCLFRGSRTNHEFCTWEMQLVSNRCTIIG